MSTSQVTNYPPASELMAKPAMSFEEWFCGVVGLPETTAEELVRSPEAPPMFLLGRRRYIRTSDAIAWLDRMAQAKPYFPRRNNRRAA